MGVDLNVPSRIGKDGCHWFCLQVLTTHREMLVPLWLPKWQLLIPVSSSSVYAAFSPQDVLMSVRRSGKENQVLPN